MLVASVKTSTAPYSGNQNIKGAVETLDYLRKHGNKVAEKRLNDLEQICQHLGIPISVESPSSLPNALVKQKHLTVEKLKSTSSEAASASRTLNQAVSTDLSMPDASRLHPQWQQTPLSSQIPGDDVDSLQLSENMIFSSSDFDNFNDFNFDFGEEFFLTGADDTDWGELERQIANHQ